ncbi:uncharacterized protein TNCT_546171 [Trichonephila clavata]|uniref:Uncharacterized protein n=1 Tax=Trichonephila clavata TaxID=2740835 RepID=A0A8X6H3V0_TRICU|nr:uncharacterized protein TNCT_546171 [Trichonephila clavata]
MELSRIVEPDIPLQENPHYKRERMGGFLPCQLRQTSTRERFQPRQMDCPKRKMTHLSEYSPDVRRIIHDLSDAKKALNDDKRLDSKSKHKYDKIFGETLESILRACPDTKQNWKRNAKKSPISENASIAACDTKYSQKLKNKEVTSKNSVSGTLSPKSRRRSEILFEDRNDDGNQNPCFLKCKRKDSVLQKDFEEHFSKFNPQSSHADDFKHREKHVARNTEHRNTMKTDKKNKRSFPGPEEECDSFLQSHDLNRLKSKHSIRDAEEDEQMKKDLRDFARPLNDPYVANPERKPSRSFNKRTCADERNARGNDQSVPSDKVAPNLKGHKNRNFNIISTFEPDSVDALLAKESRGLRTIGNELTESDTNLKADMKNFIKEFCPPNIDMAKYKSVRFKMPPNRQKPVDAEEFTDASANHISNSNRRSFIPSRRRNCVRACYCACSECGCNKNSKSNRNDPSTAKESKFENSGNEMNDKNRFRSRRNRRVVPPENVFETPEPSDTYTKDDSIINILSSNEQKSNRQKSETNLTVQNDKRGEVKSTVFKTPDEFFEELDNKCFRNRDRTKERNEKYSKHPRRNDNCKSHSLDLKQNFVKENHIKVRNDNLDTFDPRKEPEQENLECFNSLDDNLFHVSHQISSGSPKFPNNVISLDYGSKEDCNKDSSRYITKNINENQQLETVPSATTDKRLSELKFAAGIQNDKKEKSPNAIKKEKHLIPTIHKNHLDKPNNSTEKSPNAVLTDVKSEECLKESAGFKDKKLNNSEVTIISQLFEKHTINTSGTEAKDDVFKKQNHNTEIEHVNPPDEVREAEKTKETFKQAEKDLNISAEQSKSTISAFLEQQSSDSGKHEDVQETLLDKVQRWQDSCCQSGRTNSIASSASSKDRLKKFNLGNAMVSTIYGSPQKNFDLTNEATPVKNTVISSEFHHRKQWEKPPENGHKKDQNRLSERNDGQGSLNCGMTIQQPILNPNQEFYNMLQRNTMFNLQQEHLESPSRPQNINNNHLRSNSTPVDCNTDVLGMNVQYPAFDASGRFAGIYPQYQLLLNYMNPLGMFMSPVGCNPIGGNFIPGLCNTIVGNVVPEITKDTPIPDSSPTNTDNNNKEVSAMPQQPAENRSSEMTPKNNDPYSKNAETRKPSTRRDFNRVTADEYCQIKHENATQSVTTAQSNLSQNLKSGYIPESIPDKTDYKGNPSARKNSSGKDSNSLFDGVISQPKDLFKAIKVKLTSGQDMATILMHGECRPSHLGESNGPATKKIAEIPESYDETSSASTGVIKRCCNELTRKPRGIVPGLEDN